MEQSRQSQSLGDLIDRIAEIRDAKAQLNKEIKALDEESAELKTTVMEMLDAAGLGFGGSSRYRASITESVVPSVEDWEAVHQFVLDERAPYLFERRLAVAAWRELKESGLIVPGTEPFTKRDLSVTKATRR